MIAKNDEEYVSKAIELSDNLEKYYDLRKKIFNESENSPLFNSKDFSNNFYNLLKKATS